MLEIWGLDLRCHLIVSIRWKPFTLVGGEMRLDLSVLPENKTLNPTRPRTHSLAD